MNQLFIYMHFFFIFFSIMVYHKILNIFHCAVYTRTWLFIHSIYNSLHLLVPSSQSSPSLPTTSLLTTTSLFCMSVSLFCRQIHLCCILDPTYKWYHMVPVFLFLTYFISMIISRCIHVDANGSISFFLWPSNIPLNIYVYYIYTYIYVCVCIYINI